MNYQVDTKQYEDLDDFTKFKHFFRVVLVKFFHAYNPHLVVFDADDKQKFDLMLELNHENKKVELFVKFRTRPAKTDLSSVLRLTKENKSLQKELYIHMFDENNQLTNNDYQVYQDQISQEPETEWLFASTRKNSAFWGQKVFRIFQEEFLMDYYLYYDDSVKLKDDDVKRHSLKLQKLMKNSIRKNDTKYTFVLGAGVSIQYGIPLWNTLLNENISDIKTRVLFNEDYIFKKIGDTALIKAQFVVDNMSSAASQKSKEYQYCVKLRALLYDKKPYTRLPKSSLNSIARCIKRYIKNNDGVITYNYDDLLENVFDSETKLSYQTVFKDDRSTNKMVTIYHVHGFLPRKGHLRSEHATSVILSESKYNYLFNNPLSWQISNQLTRFRENVCVLVGLSISDPSLRRLLESVKISNDTRFHYAIMARELSAHKTTINDVLIVSKHFERIGVHVIWTDEHDDIADLIDAI